jgi:hypothetical protein
LRFQPVFLFFSFGNDCFQYWLDACTFILKKGSEINHSSKKMSAEICSDAPQVYLLYF